LNTFYRPLLKILLSVLFVLAIAPDLHAEKRIGVIMTGNVPYYNEMHQTLADELNRRFAGKEKIEFLLQRPFPNDISWSNAARKLIAFDVDLIVTYGSPATLAVIHEKSRIPLVFAGFYEPEEVAAGIKNVSGCGFKVPLSSILRYFKHLKQVSTLGIIFSSVEEDSIRQYKTMLRLTEQQGIRAEKYDIRTKDDLDKLKTKKPDVVFVTSSSLVHLWLEEIVTILEKNKVPVADILPDTTDTGVLMTLYQPAQAQGEVAAEIAWQILNGAKPAEPAISTLRDTELVFNLVEARRLGINFPIQLLIEATKVIE
jgi:putative ABC transport system substrate-binding protein